MPSPGSLVRLTDGRIALVTKVTPDGKDDRIWDGGEERRVTVWDLAEIIHETG